MIKRIVLDLDDVLNSCTMYILHCLGCGVGPFDYDKYPTQVGYDMVGAWAALVGRERVPVPMFWEWVARQIWEQMPISEEFGLIDSAAEIVGQENVLIASSPTKNADCMFGKYQWMHKHLPDWMQRQFSITPRKHWLAQEGVLLIDDSEDNCMRFSMAGGSAILVPRPWNSRHSISGSCGHYVYGELEEIARQPGWCRARELNPRKVTRSWPG